MQSLFIIGLSVLVFVHSLSRFRNLALSHDTRDIPGPAGAFTTSLNYWGGAVIYGGIFVLGYVALLLILKNADLTDLAFSLASVGVGADRLSELKTQISEQGDQIPVWLASLLTFALPTVPLLSRMDQSLRARIQQLFGIPEFAWRLADQLATHRDYRFLGNVEEHFHRIVNQHLQDMNIGAEQLHDARQCDELYLRMLYLGTLLDDWAMVDARYHRFAEEQGATRTAIQAKLDALKPVALQFESARDPLLQSMLQASLDDAWLQLRRYVACAVLACERSAEGIEQRLRLLGFSRSEEVPYSDFFPTLILVFVLTLLGTQAVVLFWDIFFFSFSSSETLFGDYLATALRAVQISILHTIAIGLAMWRLGVDMPYPWLRVSPRRDLLLGWTCGTLIALALPITSQDTQVLGATLDYLARALLLGLPVGFASYSFVRLITDTAFLAEGRMNDSMRQGLYTALPTALVVGIAELCELSVSGHHPVVVMLVATSVTFVIGAVAGAVLPLRYRRKRDYFRITHDQVVTVVGAGIAGLACARHLRDHGFQVQVLEADSVAGGRIRSTVYGQHEFDIGAQVFQEAPREFSQQIERWKATGLIQPWHPRVIRMGSINGLLVCEEISEGETRYTGVSRMDSLITRGLHHGFTVNYRTRVTGLSYDGDHGWSAFKGSQCLLRASHYMVLAVPAAAAEKILAGNPSLRGLHARVEHTASSATWVCALSFDKPLLPRDDSIGSYQIGLFHKVSPVLNRGYCVSHKPGRGEGGAERWVLVADHGWSLAQREASESDVTSAMLAAFWECGGYLPVDPAAGPRGYLWEDAMSHSDVEDSLPNDAAPGPILAEPYYFDAGKGIGMCGDWCASFGVGYAWFSGNQLARKIVEDAGIY